MILGFLSVKPINVIHQIDLVTVASITYDAFLRLLFSMNILHVALEIGIRGKGGKANVASEVLDLFVNCSAV